MMNLDAGEAPVVDLAQLQRMRVQVGRVHLKTFAFALVTSAAALAVP